MDLDELNRQITEALMELYRKTGDDFASLRKVLENHRDSLKELDRYQTEILTEMKRLIDLYAHHDEVFDKLQRRVTVLEMMVNKIIHRKGIEMPPQIFGRDN